MPNQASTQAKQTTSRARAQNAGRAREAPKTAQPVTGQQAAEDQLYGVVSVLYHALQGEQAYEKYANDARRAGDEELQQFFDDCRSEEHERAQQAKRLLADRLDVEDEDEEEDEDEDEEEDEETSGEDEEDDEDEER